MTLEKLRAMMDDLPNPDNAPAKLRCAPSTIPWLLSILRSLPSVQSLRGGMGPLLTGMLIEEDADVAPDQVQMISTTGKVMTTITRLKE